METENINVVGTVNYTDPVTTEETSITVSKGPDRVFLTVTMKSEGEYELVLDSAKCAELIAALQAAR